jgi:signal transduction histidine kinase
MTSSWLTAPLAAHRREDVFVVAAAGAGATLAGLAAAIVVTSGSSGDHGLVALASALVVGVPVAVGVAFWRAGHYVRFGRLLVAWGLVNFLPILAYSTDSVAYSIGRVGIWLSEPVGIAVVLAFWSGNLKTRLERGIVIAFSLTVVFLYLPTAFLVDRYPEPSLWAGCRGDCPDNAFVLVDEQPAFVDAFIRPAREVIMIAVYLAVVAVLARKLRRATELNRRVLSPVLPIAIVRLLVLAGGVVARRAAPESQAVDALAWIYILTLPALAAAFFVGYLRLQLFVGDALERLSVRLGEESEPADVRDLLASTLHDPSLRIAYPVSGRPGRWIDAGGTPVALPAKRFGHGVTPIGSDGRTVAALIHDPVLAEHEPFVEAAGRSALARLENERLHTEVEKTLEDLRESRARIQAVADSERRRIERDLHDGAQQRLVALRVRLQLASESSREEPGRAPALFRDLAGEVDEALDEVRGLLQGIYPSLLADRGLAEALQDAARRAPTPTSVTARGIGRYSEEIETAIYFCCLEALQNVAKHAPNATSVSIVLVDDGTSLRVDVWDDGEGFDASSVREGSGLTNMRDRIGAIGGRLRIDSTPGVGTAVSAVVPHA